MEKGEEITWGDEFVIVSPPRAFTPFTNPLTIGIS